MKKNIKASRTGWVFSVSDEEGLTYWYYFKDPQHNNEHMINYIVENNCFSISHQFVGPDGRIFNVMVKNEEKMRDISVSTFKSKHISKFFMMRDIFIYYRSLVIDGEYTIM